jgi:hypothetical protein
MMSIGVSRKTPMVAAPFSADGFGFNSHFPLEDLQALVAQSRTAASIRLNGERDEAYRRSFGSIDLDA